MATEKPLHIFKSSAGSGKTHTLVSEYLGLTLKDPSKFKNILAITFTNKAAGEMKERIIESLKEFAEGNTKNALGEELKNKNGFNDDYLVNTSRILLSRIIHNFDDLNVSTIDSFVHKIIKTFSQDVDLPSDFDVVIDMDDIIPEITENIYNKLDYNENKTFTNFMINFVNSLTDDEQFYDPQQHLVNFIKKHTEEENFRQIKKIENITLEKFNETIGKLNKKLSELKKEIIEASKRAVQLFEKNGLTINDFSNKGSGIGAYLTRHAYGLDDSKFFNKNAEKAVENNSWYTKSTPSAIATAIDSIVPQLKEIYEIISEKGKEYLTTKLVYSKLYQVIFIKELSAFFDEYTQTTRKVHISEFNKKISSAIAGEPAPFIFDRIGTKFEHFLIDEFQDTSLMQWYNLLPLIENALAQGNFNMLVGDAKQAIYRFREGEVELFTSLPKLYGNPDLKNKAEREKMLEESTSITVLDTNYRSYKEIVRFNNDFFSFVKTKYPGLVSEIYDHHEQNVFAKKNRGGYVSMELIPSENIEDYEGKRLLKIEQYIQELCAKGFSYKDICILTRGNKQSSDIASYLLERNISVISSESLLLKSSPEVRSTVAFIKALYQQDNVEVLTELLYNLLIIYQKTDHFDQLINELSLTTNPELKNVLNYFGLKIKSEALLQKTILETAITFYGQISKDDRPNIYFQYFLDFVQEKENVHENRPDKFIELWESKKENLFIVMPEGEDSVQIMTIHKAKGLKFQAVILDFIDRKSGNSKNEFWSDPKLKDFPEIKTTLLPIKRDLNNLSEKFLSVYEHENSKTILDFINLVYVAFTRPVEALFIFGEYPFTEDGKPKSSRDRFSKLLKEYFELKFGKKPEKLRINYGELQKLEDQKTEKKKHVIWEHDLSHGDGLPVAIASAEPVYWEKTGGIANIAKGNLIHGILSKIITSKDIDKALLLFLNDGIIDKNEYTLFKTELEKVVNHNELKEYFSKSREIKTEVELLDGQKKTLRPDRVVFSNEEVTVIDYKTGAESDEHIEQVRDYIKAIQQQTHKKVSGKLVYLGDELKIKEVV
jgi:ATP-dependent exoDNAse (exonuclease V) beta subunit